MNNLRLAILLSGVLLATGCISDPPATRNRSRYRISAGWDSSTPYGSHQYTSQSFRPGRIQPIYVDRYAYKGISSAYGDGTRVYTGVSGLPEVLPVTAPPPLPERISPPRSRPTAVSAPSRVPTIRRASSPRPPAAAPRRELILAPRLAPRESPEPFWAPFPTTEKARLVLANRGGRTPLNQPPSVPAIPAPLAPDELPLALPSPGRIGFAKLPGHPDLPELDVRGIIPGTSVEIPNPGFPGQTIQFRVP
jgi:hypothetical protein